MEKKFVITHAENLLELIIKSQPGLFAFSSHGENTGKLMATICQQFIDSHVAYLEKRDN